MKQFGMSYLKTLLKIFGSCFGFGFWVFFKNNGRFTFIFGIVSILYTNKDPNVYVIYCDNLGALRSKTIILFL